VTVSCKRLRQLHRNIEYVINIRLTSARLLLLGTQSVSDAGKDGRQLALRLQVLHIALCIVCD